MNCSCCKHLVNENKKDGEFTGAQYYCKKNNCYVSGNCKGCNSFEKTYARNNYECQKIYEEGENFSDDTREPSFYMSLLIFIILAGMLLTFINNLSM